MLADTIAVSRLQILIDVLQPFALADRIEDQHDISQPREPLSKTLIGSNRLTVGRMPATSHHTRQWQLAVGWHIQIRRDRKTRSAFENHFLNSIGIALHDTRHARIERSPLRLWPK